MFKGAQWKCYVNMYYLFHDDSLILLCLYIPALLSVDEANIRYVCLLRVSANSRQGDSI